MKKSTSGPHHPQTVLRVGARFRWDGTLAYFLYLTPIILGGPVYAQSIRPDGNTQTVVQTQGAVTNVTTSTIRGHNAFNSFSVFNVPQGTTANLHVPASAHNVINIVRDQRSDIHGVLNSIRDGRIGGNVWFANPHGFLIGPTGVVNVGALTLTTPTQQFVDNFFSSPGNPDDAAVAQLLAGTEPRNAAAAIAVQGRINAADGVRLSAGAINVAGSIYSGARFVGTAPDFTDVVNTNGLVAGTNVVVREGRIELVADGDVRVSGTVAAPGGSSVRGGDIRIEAGGSIELEAGASIVARGDGENSSGGTVVSLAAQDARFHAGATIDASAGASGDGGHVELSAKREVELAGGTFRADGTGGGKAGSVLVDPATITVSSHILRGTPTYTSGGGVAVSGADITLQADEQINVAEGTVISSRAVGDSANVDAHRNADSTGSSGSITLQAPKIDLASGSAILAHVQGGCVGCLAGDIALEAARTHGDLDVADLETRVSMSHAMLRGRDVTVRASSGHTSTLMPVVLKDVKAIIDIDSTVIVASRNLDVLASAAVDATTPSLLPFGTVDVDAEAAVTVRGSSNLTAGGSATLASTSNVKARVVADMPNVVTLPADAGVAVILVDSKATVDVLGTSTLDVGGALSLDAANTTDLTAKADASPGGSVAIGGTVAVVKANTTTRAAIAGAAAVTRSGSLELDAESINRIEASAKAAAQGATDQGTGTGGTPNSKTQETLGTYQEDASTSDGGVGIAAAVAVSDLDSQTAAYLDSTGTIASSGSTEVSSSALNQATVTADGSSAEGGVGVGVGVALNLATTRNEATIARSVQADGVVVEALLAGSGEVNRFETSATSGAAASNVGVAGALALNKVDNRTRAQAAGSAAIDAAGGDVRIEAQNESESIAKGQPADGGATGDKIGIGATVALNILTNETLAALADSSSVVNARNLDVIASGTHSIETSAEAGAEGGIGLTPVVAVSVVDNTTTARLGTGSELVLTGALGVSATHSGSTASSAGADVAGEKAAIGAAVAVTVANDAAVATTARDVSSATGIAFEAYSDATTAAIAKASAKGGKEDTSGDDQNDGVDQEIVKQTELGKKKQAAGSNNANQQPASAETAGENGGTSKVSVAAAIAVNVADSKAEAFVPDALYVSAGGGALRLSASNNTDASASADGSATGESAVGVGAGVAINVVHATNSASLGAGTHTAEGVVVEALMTDTGDSVSTLQAEAKSGGGSSNIGVAGSLGLNIVDHASVARIGAGANVNAGSGAVRIEAENRSESVAKALPAEDGGASGEKIGIGASVAVNVVANESRAELADGATLDGGGALTVKALGAHTLTTEAEAGSAGGIGLTPVAAISVSDNRTVARIGSGNALDLDGTVRVEADHSAVIATRAKGSSEGSKAAIGIAVAVTIASDGAVATTDRSIDADEAQFLAHASQSTQSTAIASAVGGSGEKKEGGADDTPEDGVDREVDKQASFGKSKQKAGSSNASQEPASAQSSEGKVSVAAAVAVNVADSKAQAFIPDGRNISASGALTVEASNNTDATAVADGSTTGSTATLGIGAAVAVNKASALTEAYIGRANVTAGGVAVRALMTDVAGDGSNQFTAEATAGAGAGKVGIAGALALNLVDVQASAEIRGDGTRLVDAGGGDVEIAAESVSRTEAKASADKTGSGGQVGVGASVALNLIGSDLTRARIGDNARVDNAERLEVTATSVSDTSAEAVAGSAGSVALDAAVAFSEVVQTTEAVVGTGTGITAGGAVDILATAEGEHTANATGDVKSGKAGLGASAAIILSETRTRAALERDLAAGAGATDHITVRATGERSYEAVAKASAAGAKDADSSTQQQKDNAKSTSTLQNTQGAQRGTEQTGSSSKLNVAAAAGVLVLDDDVTASIGANRTVQAGGNIAVSAENASDFSARGLGDSIDITKMTTGADVGIGVGVGIAVVRNDTTAAIGDGAHVVDAAAISVSAESTQNRSAAFVNKLAAEGVSGAGSGKFSLAGAAGIVNSDARTHASIGDDIVIDHADAVSITADNTSKLAAKAWSAATSGKVGIGASVAIVVSDNEYQAWLGDDAVVTTGSLTVAARNHEVTGAVPLDFSLGDITNLDKASSKITDANLQVILGENNYYTEAIAGGASNQVAVAGAFAINIFEDKTEAWIGADAQVTATGAVDVNADSEVRAKAFAGGVSASGKVGVGVASSDISNKNETRAYLGADADILNSASVRIGAAAGLDLTVISASAGAASTAGVSGVVSLVLSDNEVEAYAADDSTIVSTGAAAISARNDIEVLNVAGVAGIGGTAGVGVSAGTNLIDNQTRAWIGKDVVVDAAGLTSVDAEASQDMLSVVVGGAGGGTAGVAASAAVNVYNPITQAWIDTGALVNTNVAPAAQSVRVSAADSTELLSIVGTVGVGGTAGVGGAADVVVIDKNVGARIEGAGSDVRAGNDVAVLAESEETIRSVGVGFSAGGTAGVQGSASVVVLTTHTEAEIAAGAKVDAQGNVVVDAHSATEFDLLAGAIGAAGTAAVGAGAAVAVIDKSTHAWIGDGAEVTALGLRPAVSAATGAFTVDYVADAAGAGEVSAPDITPSNGQDSLTGGSQALEQARRSSRATAPLQGLAVTATNQDDIEGFAVTGAASGAVAVTLSGEVGVHTTDTQAWIGNGAQINASNDAAGAQQSVRVAAGHDSYHLGIGGALAASGAVGVGVGADVVVMEHQTKAHIGDSALVNARKDVAVAAQSNQEIVSISASLGASGTVGVSGSVSVLSFDNATWAWIGDSANVDAGGNVAVRAHDETDTTLIAGTVALGVGGAGIGGGVGIYIIDKDTRAWVGDSAMVDARGANTSDMTAFTGESFGGTTASRGLLVEARSKEDLFTVSAAGAAGLYVGIAGAVSVATVDSDTTAYIGNGAQINTRAGTPNDNQDVTVTARNDFSSFNVSGALGIGAVGIAGAVDVGVIRNDTTAFIGDAVTVNAKRDVDVNALARKDVETYVVSASGGLAGIAAGVAVYSVGGGLDAESRDRLKSEDGDTTGAYADDQATDSSITDSFLANYSDTRIRDASQRVKTERSGATVSGTFTATETRTLPAGTAGFIGTDSVVNAGRHVDVDARETVEFDMLTGAIAVGAVGLGAGVGVATVQNDVHASIGARTQVTAGAAGNVGVTARLDSNLDALGIAGTGGIVAVDAAVSILADKSSVTASIGDAVTIDRAGLVRVEADDDRVVESETYSVSVGLVTAGASVAKATASGETQATIGADVQIGQGAGAVGGVRLNADANRRATADATAGKGGLGLAASGTIATATVTAPVTASIGAGADIEVQGDVDIDAAATVAADAAAKGINVSLGGSVGASIATATATPTVMAVIGSGATVTADNLYLDARQVLPASGISAHAHATGASGGLLIGANATVAKASNSAQVRADLGANSTLDVSGTTHVMADNRSHQVAQAEGISVGLLALGANEARADSVTFTEAAVSDDVKVTGGALEVVAQGDDDNFAYALAGSGGAVSGLASDAKTSTVSQTYARTGSGSDTRAIEVGTLIVDASHTARFNAQVDSTNASLVGASGAEARNDVNAITEAHVGANAYILADNIGLQARNAALKPWLTEVIAGLPGVPQWNVQSGSGGLFDLPAATSTTVIINNALVQVGSNAYLEQTGDRASPGTFRIDAANEVVARDKVKVDSGGAIALPAGESQIFADVNTAQVKVRPGAEMLSLGDMNIGARSVADVYTQVAVDTYGVAGAPQGKSVSRFQALNRVELDGAKLESWNDINIAAGASSAGALNNIAATARTDLYNNTLIPIDTDPTADAIIDTRSEIDIKAGTEIGAEQHVTLYAEKGNASASGIGIGKDIYREALAAVASAFSQAFGGGPVSFETRSGRSIKTQRSDLAVDGAVKVGIHRSQELEIGIDGSITKRTDGMAIVDTGFKDVAADILARIEALENLIAQYSVNNTNADAAIAVAAYRSEISFLERKLDELGFPRERDENGNPLPGFSGVQRLSEQQAAIEAKTGITKTVEAKTTERTTLENQNTTLITQNTTLATQNTTLTTQNTTLTTQNTTLTAQNTTLAGEILVLLAQQAALDKNASDYTEKFNALQAQIDARQLQISNNNVTIANNNTTIANNDTTIANNNATITANNTTIANNTTTIADLTEDIGDLQATIAQIQTNLDNNVYSTELFGGPVARVLTIGDVEARLGNIYVRADRLHGAGTLDAPGDAEIKVTNNSPSFLVFGNLTIPPDAGGKIYFNNVEVNDNAAINRLNAPLAPGVPAAAASFALRTAENQVDAMGNPLPPAQPQILITSKYDPLDPFYTNATPADTPPLGPDIVLRGDLSNLRGLVKIEAAAGNIRLEQKLDVDGKPIPGETATIIAGEVDIKTRSGDFVQSYTDGFFHTAGAPLVTEPGDSHLAFPQNIDEIKRNPEVAGAGIIANGSVLIAARYLNINGTIQSGIPEWGVRIPADAAVKIGAATGTFAQAKTHYESLSPADKAKPGAEFYDVADATVSGLPGNLQGNWEKIAVRYNAKEDRLELAGVQVQGGYIELFGQIFNTNKDGGGKLRVLDGYGQIKIDNATSLPLWVGGLDTGRGVKGEIVITNITGIDASGAPILSTTRYTRDPGDPRTGEVFKPTENLRYVMQVGYDQSRVDFYRYSQQGWFGGTAFLESKALDAYRIDSITRSNDPLSRGESLRVWDVAGDPHYFPETSAAYDNSAGTITGGRQQTETTSNALTPGRSWRECNWWTLCIRGTYYQEFTVTTGTKTTITESVRADYPIGIEYIGFDNGSVQINSAGNVVLRGAINNRTGDTSIASGAGSITQSSGAAIVGGNNIALSAHDGIGQASQKLQVNLDGGKLDATSASGEIHVAEMLGDLKVGTVGGAGVARVVLEADGSLLGWDTGSFVQGKRVELVSRNAGIGELGSGVNTPFTVITGYSSNMSEWPNYGLSASARESINIRNVSDAANPGVYSGNLLLIAADSASGDVRIETSGAVIDNNPFATTDERTVQDLANLWDAMRLRGDRAVEKAADAIASFERSKVSAYNLYWLIRSRQADPSAYDPSFQYKVSATERAAMLEAGKSDADIALFEQNRTTQYHQLHAQVGSFTASYRPNFEYHASDAEKASITQGSSWTDAQLAVSFGAGLLKELTDTVTVVKEPNAKGNSVTLIASQGIGSYNDPLQIDLSAGIDTLTQEQKAALAAAERGDTTLSGSTITIVQPRPVNVTTGSTGALWAEGGSGVAFIGSEQDLRIGRVQATGDVRIKTAGSLVNAAAQGDVNVVGANMILEAASGGIGGIPHQDTGFVATPLRIAPTAGAAVTARAAGDVYLESQHDFGVDTMFSRRDVRLTAGGSIAAAFPGEDALNVLGTNVFLTALAGGIGTPSDPLEVGVGAGGFITATAPTFGSGVYLHGPLGERFDIASVEAGDAVHLGSAGDLKVSGAVTGPGPIQLIAGGEVRLTPTASVRATTLGLLLDADTLVMEDGSSMMIDVGTIRIDTTGDALVTGITTGNPTESAIHITSGGRVLSGGNTRVDITAEGGPDSTLTIEAAGGVGNEPLEVRVSKLNIVTGGIVHVDERSSVEVGTIQAAGEILLNAGGSVTVGSASADSIAIQAPDAIVTTGAGLLAGSQVLLKAANIDATVTHTGATGRLQGEVTGYSDGMADHVALTLSSGQGIDLARLWTQTGAIANPSGDFLSRDTLVGRQLTFTNPSLTLLVYELSKGWQPGADVQLYSGGEHFSLNVFTNHVFTDAHMIYRSPFIEVITPDARNTSAAELGIDELARNALTHTDPPAPKTVSTQLVSFTGIPVSLEGDPDAPAAQSPACPDDAKDPACVR